MKRFLLLPIALFVFQLSALAQSYTWAEQFSGTSYQMPKDIAVDPSGSSYSVGWMIGTSTFGTISVSGVSYDGFLAKYDKDGDVQWATRLGGSSYDGTFEVARDDEDGLYVAGWFYGNSMSVGDTTISGTTNVYESYLAKFDTNGYFKWVVVQTGATSKPVGLAAKGDDVYVELSFNGTMSVGGSSVSSTTTSTGYHNNILVKYDSAGSYQWRRHIEGDMYPNQNWYWKYGGEVAIDGSGNPYCTGSFRSTDTLEVGSLTLHSTGVYDAYLIKFNQSTGAPTWARKGGGSSWEYGTGLVIDDSDRIFMSGYNYSTNGVYGSISLTSSGPYWVRYNTSGTAQAGMVGSGTCYNNSIQVDNDGNLYMTGIMAVNINLTMGGTTVTNPSGSSYTPYFFKYDYDNTSTEYLIIPTTSGNIEYSSAIDAGNEDHVIANGSFYSSVTFGSTSLSGNSYDGFLTRIANCDHLQAAASSIGGDSICSGETVTLAADSNSLYGYQWLYNGAAITGEINEEYTTGTAGDYAVVIDSAGCVDTSNVIEVVVNNLPNVSHTNLPNVCEADDPFTLTGGTPSGGVYSGTGVTGGTTFDPGSAATGNNIITYTYTDANGCADSVDKTITVQTSPAIFTTTISACENDAPTSLTASAYGYPTGGTHTGPGVYSNIFDPDSAGGGTHIIHYTSSNGCESPDSITATVTPTSNVTLDSFPDKCVTAGGFLMTQGSPTGGSYSGLGVFGSYYYPSFAGAGTHQIVYSKTTNGCTGSDTNFITVDPVATSTISSLPDLCADDDTLLLTPYGSPSGGSFSGTGVSSDIFDPAVAGTGSFTMTYTFTNACGTATDTEMVVVNVLPSIAITPSHVSCNGGSDGSATAAGSGTATPYSYSWSTSANTATVTGLSAGTYTVTVTDGNGCDDTETVIITEPTALSVSTTANATSCNGGADGTVGAFASGGTSGYTYAWSNGATTSIVTGLSAGTYTVTVTDANGCTETATATVTEPTAVVASISGTNVSCNGGSDGSATASATGGTSGYSYTWSTSATTATVTGLSAGTYTVTATDANGCTDTETITITEPTALTASIGSVSNVSCNGGSDGSATASGSGGTTSYSYAWSTSATTATVTGLSAGTYTVTVTDANGCTDTESVTITEPSTAVTASIGSVSNVSCNGGSDGSATASGSGGTGTITFVWSTSATTATITGLSAGTYTVTATDANGCEDTETVTITEPTVLTASIGSVSNASCNGGSDGSATASASGGTTTYTYAWSTSATTATVTGLSAGTYTVTVTDANGCTDTESVTITEPTSVVASISSTNVSCSGGSDGSATASATGGTSGYSYAWSTSATTATVTGLSAGTYTVTATDANGCTDTASITITEPSALIASIGSVSNVSCNGGSDGSATASASGGTTTYSYTWSTSATTATVTGLSAGTYTVTVTDANGCTDTESVTITQPTTAVTASIGSVSNVSCNGGSDGSATASGSGGTGTITFVWSTSATTATITGLSAGTYTVTATDANGCEDTASVTITEPNTLVASIGSVSNASCNGSADGSATASASGGTTTYSYAWSNSATTATATGLSAGTYTVTVTDANGCTDTASVTITEPTSVVASISGTNVSCNGGSDGTATASATGGTTAYSYAWSTSATTATVTGLSAGTYTVTATDANGCTDTASITITEPSALIANIGSVSNVSCNGGSDGSATASAAGGTTTYSYTWSTSATTATVTGLSAGTYTVTVTDANGCTDTESVTITQPTTAVTASIGSVSNVSCNGGSDGSATASGSGGTGTITFVWSTSATTATITGLSAGTYTVTATDANGCEDTASVTITEPNTLVASIGSVSNASCNGSADGSATASATGGTTAYSYTWSNSATTATATGLSAGTYTVTVTDANGCTDTASVTITEPTSVVASISSTNVSCNGGSDGSATASATGGTSGYSYAWSTSATTATVTGLSAGTYTVTATDANGCTDTASITITEPSALIASIGSVSNVSCNGGSDGSATASASGGTTTYSYTWSTSATTATVTGLSAGTYTVTVTDANGCTDTESVTITQPTTAVTASIGSVSNVSCNGGSDGSATASGSGGTGTITFVWSTSATTATITGLSAGTYTVTATDANGCEDTASVTITEPNTLVASIGSVSNASCNGSADGSATASATGGTTTYSYAWSNSATTATVTGLSAGTYTVTVTDANGCTDTSSVTITEPTSVVTLISVLSNVSCNGGSDGALVASASGGTGAYGYLWSNGDTAQTADSLSAGSYTVTVTDANGCTDTETGVIFEPTALSLTVSVDSNVSCFGWADGGASASVSGGTTPYSYSWTNGDTTASITGLAAIPYGVFITDANGCEIEDSITITEPTQLVVSAVVTSNATCLTDSNGAATVTASGGTTSYSYAWSNGDTTASVSNLWAGMNTVVVTDANGCSEMDTVQIVVEDTIPPVASAVTNYTVYLSATGQFTLSTAQIDSASYDDCGIDTMYLDLDSFNCSQVGTQWETLTVHDVNGNVSFDSIEVTVVDTVAPMLTANSVTLHLDASGQATYTASTATASASDACGIDSTWITDGNVTCADVGTFTDTLYAVDVNGNVAMDIFSVTVIDTLLPTIAGQNITAYLDATGSATIQTSDINNGTSDNCGIDTLYLSQYTFSCADSGSNTVTLFAADVNGNLDSADFTVTIFDTVAPIALAQNLTVYLDANGSVLVDADSVDAGSSDNCAIDEIGLSQSLFDCGDVGANTVDFFVKDVSGNETTISVTITVVDTVAPILAANNDTVYLDATGNGTYTAASVTLTAFDSCGLDSVWIAGGSVNCADTGSFMDTLFAVDVNGNQSSVLFQVWVFDTISPTVIGQNITVYLDTAGTVSITAADIDNGSNDNCAIDSLYLSDEDFGCADTGSNNVILYAVDVSGNVGLSMYTVTVLDTISPVVMAQNITVYLDTYGVDSIGVSDINNGSFDNCLISSLYLSDSIFTCADTGVNTVSMFAIDASGNVSSTNFTVTVMDTNAPIVIASNFTVYLDANGQATLSTNDVDNGTSDNCAVDSLWLSDTLFGCGDLGTSAQTLYAVDGAGNVDSSGFFLTVLDTLTTVSINIDSNLNCFGDTVAQVTASAAGMTSVYSYSWSNGVITAINANIGEGTYVVTATDLNGCSAIDSVTLTEPDELIGSIFATDINCNGYADGTAIVTISGGTPGYTYLWSTGAVADSVTGLDTGAVSVLVIDTNGCTITLDTFIQQPALFEVLVESSDSSLCLLDSSATLWANTSGGTGAATVIWLNGDTVDSIFNQPAGLYVVNAIDENGCTAIDSFEIMTDTLPNISLNIPTDTVCQFTEVFLTGENISGGVFSGPGVLGDTLYTDTVVGTAHVTYTYTDANGCQGYAADSVEVLPDANISFSVDPLTACAGSIVALDIANPAGGWYELDSSLVDSTNAWFLAPDSAYAGFGIYAFTNACGSDSDTFSIVVNPLPVVDLGDDQELCNSNSITFDAGAHTAYLWYDGTTSSTHVLNGGESPLVDDVNVWVEVTDSNGCVAADSVFVDVEVQPTFYLGNNMIACLKDTITLSVDNVYDNFLWSTGETGTSILAHDGSIITPGQYTFYVTGSNDNGVCSYSDTIMIRLDDCDSTFVGLDDMAGIEISFQAYPNPARDVVNIRTKSSVAIDVEQLTIVGADGKLYGVLNPSDWSRVDSETINLDLSQFASGVYYIQVAHAHGVNNLRVVIGK